jgi:hypothetical protein
MLAHLYIPQGCDYLLISAQCTSTKPKVLSILPQHDWCAGLGQLFYHIIPLCVSTWCMHTYLHWFLAIYTYHKILDFMMILSNDIVYLIMSSYGQRMKQQKRAKTPKPIFTHVHKTKVLEVRWPSPSRLPFAGRSDAPRSWHWPKRKWEQHTQPGKKYEIPGETFSWEDRNVAYVSPVLGLW